MEYLVCYRRLLTEHSSVLCTEDIKEIIVESRHFERANTFLQEIDKHIENMMDEITVTTEQRRFRAVLERIYKKIKSAGASGISHSDLSRAFPKIEHSLTQYIIVLTEEERIVTNQFPTKGRSKVVYYDVEYA